MWFCVPLCKVWIRPKAFCKTHLSSVCEVYQDTGEKKMKTVVSLGVILQIFIHI